MTEIKELKDYPGIDSKELDEIVQLTRQAMLNPFLEKRYRARKNIRSKFWHDLSFFEKRYRARKKLSSKFGSALKRLTYGDNSLFIVLQEKDAETIYAVCNILEDEEDVRKWKTSESGKKSHKRREYFLSDIVLVNIVPPPVSYEFVRRKPEPYWV